MAVAEGPTPRSVRASTKYLTTVFDKTAHYSTDLPYPRLPSPLVSRLMVGRYKVLLYPGLSLVPILDCHSSTGLDLVLQCTVFAPPRDECIGLSLSGCKHQQNVSLPVFEDRPPSHFNDPHYQRVAEYIIASFQVTPDGHNRWLINSNRQRRRSMSTINAARTRIERCTKAAERIELIFKRGVCLTSELTRFDLSPEAATPPLQQQQQPVPLYDVTPLLCSR
jgi:hypothetical protein